MSAYDYITLHIKASKYSRNQWDNMALYERIEMKARNRELYNLLRNRYDK